MTRPSRRVPAVPPRLAALAIAVLATACSSATVNTDFDRGADFARYKSFSYRPGSPAKNQLIDRRIQSAVEDALVKRGMTKSDSGGGDLVATYHVALENELDIQSFGYGAYGPYWSAGPTSTQVRNVPVGTLIVDLLDSAGTHLVWRGEAKEEVSKDPEKVTRQVNQMVEQMFRNYPPKK